MRPRIDPASFVLIYDCYGDDGCSEMFGGRAFFRKIFETEDRDFCFKVLFSFNVSHLRVHQSILWVFLSLLCFVRVFFEGALQSITAGGLNLLCWCAARKYTQGFWLTRIIHVDSYYIRRHAHTQGKKRLLLQHASADELQWCQSKMLIRISEICYGT